MSRAFALVGGLLFVGSLLFFGYSYGWRFQNAGPWSRAGAWQPAAIDLILFTVFALHHSVFARTPLKGWVERASPAGLERAIYVWIASVLFVIVCAAWQPVPGTLWRLTGVGAGLLRAVQVSGAILTVVAARRLDTLALAGVRQTDREAAPDPLPHLDQGGPYRLVRHPIYLGWFAIVWVSPSMNGTRATFAAVSCLYLLVAIVFEERDLRRLFGAAYAQYAARVKWKVVPFLY
jgi:protein-S-isoprenylcysteine O-methyltransferase Ste14